MERQEYETLLSEAKREYQETVVAIERVWQLSQRLSAAPVSYSGASAPRQGELPISAAISAAIGTATRLESLKDLVLEEVRRQKGEFTTTDIMDALAEKNFDRASVSSTVKKLAEDPRSGFEIVEVGRGSRPSVYRNRINSTEEIDITDLLECVKLDDV